MSVFTAISPGHGRSEGGSADTLQVCIIALQAMSCDNVHECNWDAKEPVHDAYIQHT